MLLLLLNLCTVDGKKTGERPFKNGAGNEPPDTRRKMNTAKSLGAPNIFKALCCLLFARVDI